MWGKGFSERNPFGGGGLGGGFDFPIETFWGGRGGGWMAKSSPIETILGGGRMGGNKASDRNLFLVWAFSSEKKKKKDLVGSLSPQKSPD